MITNILYRKYIEREYRYIQNIQRIYAYIFNNHANVRITLHIIAKEDHRVANLTDTEGDLQHEAFQYLLVLGINTEEVHLYISVT